jgi:AraC-like DNA-binding protein
MNDFLISRFNDILYIKDSRGRLSHYPSRHSACFILTLSGRIRFSFADAVIETSPTQGIFIPKGANYINNCLEDAESIQINLDTVKPYERPLALKTPDRKTAMLAYENISRHALSGSAQDRFYILGELYLLARHLFPEESSLSSKERLAEKAHHYLQRELSRPTLLLEEAAAHCSVSPVYLRKVFAEVYGKSPFAVLTQLRMTKAHTMLLEKRPVKEVAFAVGYSDIYQFSRAYKRYFGFPPGATKN